MTYGVTPVSSTTSPVPTAKTSPARCHTDVPRVMATTVRAASSWIRSAHGGAIEARSMKASRARGPSSNAASGSMGVRLNEFACDQALLLWIILTRGR